MEMFAVVPPVFVTATVRLDVVPVVTLPKPSDVGEEVSTAGGFVAVPVSVTAVGELLASLTNDTLPFTEPATVGANVTVTCWFALGARVSGSDNPLTLSPAPVTFAAVIVSDDPPVLLSSSVWLFVVCVCTLPKATVPVDVVNTPGAGATPVPASAIDKDGLLASLVIAIDPGATPATPGAKVNVRTCVAFGARVKAVPPPVRLYPVPLTATFDTLAVVPPVFVTATVKLETVPVVTLPKDNDVGVAVSTAGGSVTVAVRFTVVGELLASLTRERLPDSEPDEPGVNVTVKGWFAFGANVNGRVRPLTLSPAPVTFAAVIVSDVPPVFVRSKVCVFVEPVCTVPNEALDGETPRTAAPGGAATPARGTVTVESTASLTTTKLPVDGPVADGTYDSVMTALPPGGTASGVVIVDVVPCRTTDVTTVGFDAKAMLTRPNPAPVTDTDEMVAVEPPVFVIKTDCVDDEPIVTVPKSSEPDERPELAGVSCDGEFCAVPVTVTFVGEFVASLTNDTLPANEPAAAGAYVSVTN